MAEDNSHRHSIAHAADLIADPRERAQREAKNGLLQFDEGMRIVESWILPDSPRPFRLRPSVILHLHRAALDGISGYAGNYRPAAIAIEGSKHEPPGAHLVPELVEDLCEYVNDHWQRPPFHLSAYAMWRLNWIHPFVDGNGRTSRILSYVLLCIRLGCRLPGLPTIPEQIEKDRTSYFDALDTADAAFKQGSVDVSKMEQMLEAMLAAQLIGVVKLAAGR